MNRTFRKYTFQDVVFRKCDFLDLTFESFEFKRCNFTKATFDHGNFLNCHFLETKFNNCDLDWIKAQSSRVLKSIYSD